MEFCTEKITSQKTITPAKNLENAKPAFSNESITSLEEEKQKKSEIIDSTVESGIVKLKSQITDQSTFQNIIQDPKSKTIMESRISDVDRIIRLEMINKELNEKLAESQTVIMSLKQEKNQIENKFKTNKEIKVNTIGTITEITDLEMQNALSQMRTEVSILEQTLKDLEKEKAQIACLMEKQRITLAQTENALHANIDENRLYLAELEAIKKEQEAYKEEIFNLREELNGERQKNFKLKAEGNVMVQANPLKFENKIARKKENILGNNKIIKESKELKQLKEERALLKIELIKVKEEFRNKHDDWTEIRERIGQKLKDRNAEIEKLKNIIKSTKNGNNPPYCKTSCGIRIETPNANKKTENLLSTINKEIFTSRMAFIEKDNSDAMDFHMSRNVNNINKM